MNIGEKQNKQANIMESLKELLDDGQTTIELNQRELQVIKEFLSCVMNLNLNKKLKKTIISTSEFLLQNRETIWKDNVCSYKINSKILKLLKILDQDLISKEKDLLNSWNSLMKAKLKQLSLPAKTDYVDSDLTWSNGSVIKEMSNSWFSIKKINHEKKNLQKTFLQFYKFLLADGTDKENTLLKIKKIKLKLTSIQKTTLKTWNCHSRYTYNKTVDIINEEHYSDFDLRNIIVPEVCNSRIPWILETPKSVRENAVFEANKNKKSAITNLKNGNITRFKLRFLSKKKESWTIGGINSIIIKSPRCFSIYPGLNFGNIKTCEDIPISQKDHQWSIHFDGIHYYAIVPIECDKKINNNKYSVCSIDPGVRTFLDVYDPYNECNISIGDDASTFIYKKLIFMDSLISERTKIKNKKIKKKLTKKIEKLKRRIKNIQNELHNKSISFLSNNYKNIIIPKLDVKNMICKNNRTIQTKTVRQMAILGHCMFIDKLKAKTNQKNTIVEIQEEKRTTKTCGNCFSLCDTIGSKKEWVCENCNWNHLRDSNASRNVLLKNIISKIQPQQICFASWFSISKF